MFGVISKKLCVFVLMILISSLTLYPSALTKLTDKHASGSFTPQSIRFPDQLVSFKEKSLKTWRDMPTWGKCLTVGVAGGGIVLLTMCAMNSKSGETKNNVQSNDQSFTFSSMDHLSSVLSEPATLPADALNQLKTLLRDNPDGAEQFLTHYESGRPKVQMLAEVMRDIIRNTYTNEEKKIVGSIIEYRELFSAYDWFELWHYACEHEAPENRAVMRDWLGENLVTELYVQTGDSTTLELAVQSGVKESAQVFQLVVSEEGSTYQLLGTLQELKANHPVSQDLVE